MGHYPDCLVDWYIVWLIVKLHKLALWLEKGASSRQLPDNNGYWEYITLQIQNLQKKSDSRKGHWGQTQCH